MKPAPFLYHRADSAEHAVSLLAEHGDEAKLLAGGQSLVPMMALHLASPTVLIDLNRATELEGVELLADAVRIGALTRHRQVEEHAALRAAAPVFAQAGSQVGHLPIRVRGTFGGSIAHADPSSEWCLLARLLDAEISVAGPDGLRVVTAEDFFHGFLTTDLAPDEIVTSVTCRTDLRATVLEQARRPGDFAMVLVGVAVRTGPSAVVEEARVALGGVASSVVRSEQAESALLGRRLDDEAAAIAGQIAASSVDPPSDVHADGWYRAHLVEVLVARAVRSLAPTSSDN